MFPPLLQRYDREQKRHAAATNDQRGVVLSITSTAWVITAMHLSGMTLPRYDGRSGLI